MVASMNDDIMNESFVFMCVQKTEGCNKMTCTKCRSYFCWLCNTLLSRSTPYSHFSIRGSPCFERLFEGVEADQDEWWEDDGDFEDFL